MFDALTSNIKRSSVVILLSFNCSFSSLYLVNNSFIIVSILYTPLNFFIFFISFYIILYSTNVIIYLYFKKILHLFFYIKKEGIKPSFYIHFFSFKAGINVFIFVIFVFSLVSAFILVIDFLLFIFISIL